MKHIFQLKYPIGLFEYQPNQEISESIVRIKSLPNHIEKLLLETKQKQLKWRYRPNGWELCQLVHHIADSHVNAYIRMRMACANSGSRIAPYSEQAWAEFPDSRDTDLANSMIIIFSLHQRWVTFLEHLTDFDMKKTYYHPADKVEVSLREAIQMYAWHGDHHYAHLVQGLKSEGKY